MALSEKSLQIKGKMVHYWQAGSVNERPILLLHGGFGHAFTQWAEVMPLLGEEYFVIAPDLPGYGHSDTLKDMSINGMLTWLHDFLNALDLEASVIIGNSFGALLGRLLTATSPARVPALIMVNGGVIPGVPPLAKFLARLPVAGSFLFDRISKSTSSKSNLSDLLHEKAILTPDFMAQVEANRRGLARIMRAITISPLPKEQTPAVPVLLLWGEADTISPLRVGEYLKKTIPGAQLSTISDCGHLPHIEAPEVFASQVSLFLRQLDRGRRGRGAGILSG